MKELLRFQHVFFKGCLTLRKVVLISTLKTIQGITTCRSIVLNDKCFDGCAYLIQTNIREEILLILYVV
jgi:glutamate synthase domain-containing protein 2